MTARRSTLAALAAALAAAGALAGCNKTSARPNLRLSGPSAVAVYHGRSERDPAALRHYLAVANERGDDLRILDAIDGRAVLAPGLILSLSVPTAPRPALLAAGSLGDGEADLLVVAPAGLSTCDPALPDRLVGCLQVVHTWTEETALATQLTLVVGSLAGDDDAAVLAVAAVPVPEADGLGGWRAAAGRVRVVAALTGARLLVAEYRRAADGKAIELAGAAVHPLAFAGAPFEAVALSGSPDLAHVYAATPDPLGAVEGVAELDLSGAFDQAPPVRAIAAGAPTTQVLAATVRPVTGLSAADPKVDVHGPEVLRVWAALDPARCGRDRVITCGLAVLDPVAGGPVPDQADPTRPHLPIFVPGTITALTAVYPPSVGALELDGTAAPAGQAGPLQRLTRTSGEHYVSTLAAAATTSGVIALIDLGRGTVALDRDALEARTSGTPASVSGATSSVPDDTTRARLGLYPNPKVETDPPSTDLSLLSLAGRVQMTPGFTPDDSWTLRWQGELPGLSALRGQLQSAPGGGLEWVAVQTYADEAPAPVYRGVGRLYDPRLALRVGDLIVVAPDDTVACPGKLFELEVTELLPPDPVKHPGGAVKVRPADDQPTVTVDGQSVRANPNCLDGKGRSTASLTFRAGGLVLTGTAFGYGGRPVPDQLHELRWHDTSGLSCPLIDDPAWPPADVGCLTQACRDPCEEILLARKARRNFYLRERCATDDSVCIGRWGDAAKDNEEGPLLAFRAGWVPATQGGPVLEARDSVLAISTSSGLTP
ncbi:MAG: hypothetical protein NDI82_08155, partial [Anaeromyxobacteraceae bacterium]|nr:hypothetical protein [Anaeromyxobacteraceae bacterium]